MTGSSTGARRGVSRWAAVGASIGLAALGVALVSMASTDAMRGVEQDLAAQTAELNRARRTLEGAAQEIVIVRMLDGASFDGDRSARLESADTRFAEAAVTIEALAAGGGSVAAEASVLLDDLDAEVLDDPVSADLDAVFTIAEDTARWAANDEEVSSQEDAIHQLSYVASLPLHVMIEGIAADIAVDDRAVDASIADFVEQVIGVVRTEGGWYGPDASSPLSESKWIDIAEASDRLPAATRLLGEMTAASSLVAYDAWMRGLGNGDTPPPVSVLVALAEADRLTAELTTVIDELVAQERVDQDEAWSAQKSKRTLLLGAAAIALILAVAVGVLAARTVSRSRRSNRDRAELALRDALTGAGSRHELDERTRALTRSPRFDHHLVLMVDLDRFKMVNDAYGHAAGDAVLVEIATRLKHTAAGIEVGRPDAETSVIRLGGDEFLLTAHGTSAFDIDAIAAELDGVRRASLPYRGERIELAFSFGICHRAGRHELDDLMAEADLAAYDDKAARSRERTAVDLEFGAGRPREITAQITRG